MNRNIKTLSLFMLSFSMGCFSYYIAFDANQTTEHSVSKPESVSTYSDTKPNDDKLAKLENERLTLVKLIKKLEKEKLELVSKNKDLLSKNKGLTQELSDLEIAMQSGNKNRFVINHNPTSQKELGMNYAVSHMNMLLVHIPEDFQEMVLRSYSSIGSKLLQFHNAPVDNLWGTEFEQQISNYFDGYVSPEDSKLERVTCKKRACELLVSHSVDGDQSAFKALDDQEWWKYGNHRGYSGHNPETGRELTYYFIEDMGVSEYEDEADEESDYDSAERE